MKVKQLKGQPPIGDAEIVFMCVGGFMVIVLLLAWIAGGPSRAARNYIKDNGCEITHREPTGRYFQKGRKLYEYETVTFTCEKIPPFKRTQEARRKE